LTHIIIETAFGPEVFQRRQVQGSGNRSTISDTIQDA
jgi:hypothetical protein